MAAIPLWQVFAAFVRMGATAFGGPAIVAHLKAELVGRRRWLSDQDFAEGLALCQVIPGATMVQLATYAGYRVGGVPGAVVAAVGFVLPAFLAMTVLTAFYVHSGSLPAIRAVFRGLGTLVVAVVLSASIGLGQSTVRDWQGVLLVFLALLALTMKISFPVIAAGAAVLALALHPRSAAPAVHLAGPNDSRSLNRFGGWAMAVVLGAALVAGPMLWNPMLAQLNLVLMKLGLLAFGGGFTLIPLIQHDVVNRLGWLTTREFIDGVALGQVTPGPVMITATFIGYKVGGLVGAATSTVAVFLPSFVVLVVVAPYFDLVKRLQVVQTMISGVMSAFIGLLLFILYQFGQASLVDWKTWALAVGVFIALRKGVGLIVLVGLTVLVSILAL